MVEQNQFKARLLYDRIDASDLYCNSIMSDCRSIMNVPFTLADPDLEIPFLSQAEAAKVHSGIMAIYRGIARLDEPGKNTPKITDGNVIRDLEVQAPMTMVFQLQLMLFIRLLRNKPPAVLLATAHAYTHGGIKDKSWLSNVFANIRIMAEHSDKFEEMRDATNEKWVEYIVENTYRFEKQVRKVLQKPASRAQIMSTTRVSLAEVFHPWVR